MKKLTLHHFHRMEIEKQQQNLINGGGMDYCVCTGTLCSCYCGDVNHPERQSDLASNMSLDSSDGANKSAENTNERKSGGGPA